MARDPHLTDLFRRCTNEDLIPVRDYILNAATNALDGKSAYKRAPHSPATYVDDLVSEIRLFGGNTFVNLFRGDGVPYLEIAGDVADKVGAKYEMTAAREIEHAVLLKVLDKARERMSAEEKAELTRIFREAGVDNVDLGAGIPLGVILAQAGVRLGGFAAYQLAMIVANAVARAVLGRGLTLAANAALARGIAVFAGPIGWAVTAIWTALDIAGPAYRVTIPVVCHVAYLRAKDEFGDQ